jgi:dinuclear metal center YbgI/SA1388 family protein
MKSSSFLICLGKVFPASLSESWDFPGYQTGPKNPGREIRRVFLCLDLTEACLPSIRKFRPDIILTHHPFFFGRRCDLLRTDPRKATLEKTIMRLKIPVYSFHTDYDKGEGGMNDTLLQILGYPRLQVGPDGLIRLATLPKPLTISELAQDVVSKLHLPYCLMTQGNARKIRRVALIAGGGSSLYPEALSLKADAFLSGDCPHHTRLDMRRYHVNYLELPHEIEEQGFLVGMSRVLRKMDASLCVKAFRFEKPFALEERKIWKKKTIPEK